jgi:hypothetical protein
MKLGSFTVGVIAGLAAAAVGQELARAPENRTWKGTVAGMPYNFNIPEWGDIAREYWNPDSNAILTPHAIGLGWGVNFAALSQRGKELVEGAQQFVDQVRPQSEGERQIPEPIER